VTDASANPYAQWIGSSEERRDIISLGHALGVEAMLDNDDSPLVAGDPLPPLWQWFYFLPQVPWSRIGPDGHPERGGFLPPVELPRRMFAGARMRFLKPLVIGEPAARRGEVVKIVEKTGGSGKLIFVTVGYRIVQDGDVRIEEEQDIVYRERGEPVPAPTALDGRPEPPEDAWCRTVTPDPVLLFRFSALTFNAHRIHYDRPYAMQEEGYPGLVVHGPLTAVMLMELVRKHSARRVKGFSFRGKAPLFDLAPFHLVAALQGDAVDLQVQGPDGKVTMQATAELAD
jgi:3-methylfumaryl-CoA hydratase